MSLGAMTLPSPKRPGRQSKSCQQAEGHSVKLLILFAVRTPGKDAKCKMSLRLVFSA